VRYVQAMLGEISFLFVLDIGSLLYSIDINVVSSLSALWGSLKVEIVSANKWQREGAMVLGPKNQAQGNLFVGMIYKSNTLRMRSFVSFLSVYLGYVASILNPFDR
jgi:hypothetical protein